MTEQITIQTADGIDNIDRPTIAEITARKVFKRDGVTLKGYRYTAHMLDGSTEIVRDLATRLYENAFLYSCYVATGKRGLASVFSFGKAPASHAEGLLIERFVVSLEADPQEHIDAPDPCASCDDADFAAAVSTWLIRHDIPFQYAVDNMAGLYIFTVTKQFPASLKAAFDYARR